jgi:RNA polymerase sigma-70 factor (ECF subfamily)
VKLLKDSSAVKYWTPLGNGRSSDYEYSGMGSVLRTELEQLYRKHRQSLFSVALTVTGCSSMAEDAVHEAFVRLCQKSEPPQGSLTSYVFAAVRNAAIDCRRRQQHQRTITESIFASASSDSHTTNGSTTTNQDDETESLKSAIDQLDELSRQIVVMKTFSELTFEEIAGVLEIPAATAATRYRRAIMKLEEELRRSS